MSNTFMDKFCGSTFWNTSLTWNTLYPTFTSCFSKTVLLWIPCGYLWLFAGVEIYFLMNSTKKSISNSLTSILKLIINSVLIFLVIIDTIINFSTATTVVYDVDIYSPIVKILSLILAQVLLLGNKKYGMHTSGFLFLFWLLMSICGIPEFSTELSNLLSNQDEGNSKFPGIVDILSYALVLMMFVLNILTDKPSADSKSSALNNSCPEETASFISRQFFLWFDSFAIKSVRNTLELKDLWDLNERDCSRHVVPTFEKYWHKTLSKTKGKLKKQASFLPALLKTFGVAFVSGTMFKLGSDLLTFVGPQILSLFITFVREKQEDWKGIMYAILLFLVSMIQTVLSQQYLNSMLGIGMRIRAVLIASIYKKSLRISSTSRKQSSTGEIVNLMAVDAQRFMDLATSVNTIWSAPMQIILAFYFLWRELGPSVIAGLAVMIVLIPINGYIAHHTKILQTQQMKNKDARIKLVNEILNGIRLLKLYAWEPSFEERVVNVRNDEIRVLKQASYLNASTSFILSCTPFLVSLATFATYVFVDENNILDANKAFVSISLFNIIRAPLNQLPQLISTLIQTYVSVKRINNFFNCEELDSDNVSHHHNPEHPIVIENGTFAWETENILKDINMRVENNSLTAVVGTFASGKSSLISAILGEMQKHSGSVNVHGKIALVSQQAWIQNSTLQNNILFGKTLDRELYDKVTEACALLPDFDILPGGDLTEIGEKGINLSGGQKQRVSLARAVYSDADVYLLDDPLSAVDSHVGKHIFEQVIGPRGLLNGKTRLFVTHGITFLSETNNIIVMKGGKISEIGSYQELLAKKSAFAEFLMHHMHSSTKENEEKQHVPDISAENKIVISKTVDSTTPHTKTANLLNISTPNKEYQKSAENSVKNGKNLITKEKVEVGNVRLSVYKHYMKCIGYPLILFTLAMYFIYQGFSIASNIWLGRWADDGDVYQNTEKRDLYLEVYAAIGFVQVITVIIANLSFTKATLDAAIKLHNQLLYNILRVPMMFFDITPIGRILARFSSDINNVDTLLPSLLQGVLSTSVQVIGTLAVISYTTPWFVTVIVPIFLANYGIQRVCVAITRQIRRLESVSKSPIYNHFGETISGVQTIRAYSQDERFCSESAKRVDTNHISYYCGIKAFRWMAVRLEFVGNLIILFTALFAVFSKTPTAGLVGLSITYAIEVTQTLKALVRVSSNVETSIVAVERIKEYEEEAREAPWTFSNEKISKTWPENGEIVFQQFNVRYRPGLDLVLKNLDVSFGGGQKIGIVGRTGSGKSSLTLSMFRVIEAASGKILVDGINIADIGLHSLRSRLTIIPQDPVLFAGTIRMNLDPFSQYSDDNLWQSLGHAYLKDFVEGLPAGLQHEIVEGGQNLSVGQRQLICLARALLKKTKILILDEATAAIDLETDAVIQNVIRSEFKECTVLTIAHRLNTILDYDRIVVLDKGEVTEIDTPSNLFQNQNSMFYKMCKDAGIHKI